MAKQEIFFPIGRLVMGDLYTPSTKDQDGNPLKTLAGEDKVNYWFFVAIKKLGELHWKDTAWGKIIYSVGASAFPDKYEFDGFSWKIDDGDNADPLTKDRKAKKTMKNCDREGFPGHWVIRFSSSFPSKIGSILNTEKKFKELFQENAINLGDYIQVVGTVDGNGSTQSSGVYINPSLVALCGYGERIFTGGANPDSYEWGGALPEGASTIPVSSTASPAPTSTARPAVHTPAPMYTPPVASAPAPAPYPQILTPAAPPMPAPPAPPAVVKLKVHATYNPTGELTREQMLAAGWTDELLKQHGLL